LIGGRKEIEHFSCGHVIPKGNLIAVSMGTGPTGGKLEFSFNFRDNPKIVR
jgi:chromosome transmission fidelity protein 1